MDLASLTVHYDGTAIVPQGCSGGQPLVIDRGMRPEFARRVVAALNACRGIPTEQLDEGMFAAMQLQFSSYARELAALKETVARQQAVIDDFMEED